MSTEPDFFLKQVGLAVDNINPGHRQQIVVPRSISHEPDGTDYNWDLVEDIQINYRGSVLRPNVFVTLRFDQHDSNGEMVIDIYHAND